MEPKPKISLEDLLQLKRAERPPEDFWPEFEQALRTKQLAAIVETRSWWRSIATSRALVRWCLPIGATAAVAMTFGSFRGVKPQSAAVAPLAHAVAVSETPNAGAASDGLAQVAQIPTSAVETVSASNTDLDHADSSSPTQQLAQAAETAPAAQTPAVDVNLAASFGLVLAQLGVATSAEPATPVAARATVIEPLTQVSTPRDSRRSRLLAYSVNFDPHAADSSDAVRSRERITRRISDESVYDSITRLGLSGDRVSIKF